MKVSLIRILIIDLDLQDLISIINSYQKKEKILSYFITTTSNPRKMNEYLSDLNLIKDDPNSFRFACNKYVNQLVDELNYNELSVLANLFK